jgi:aspartokinase-like uncharacterized kinase
MESSLHAVMHDGSIEPLPGPQSAEAASAARPGHPTSVLKLGGSLLEPPDFPELPSRLAACIQRHGGARPVIVVGGGVAVDLIRRWGGLFGLDEEFCHWLSVRALSITSRLVARLLPNGAHVDDIARLADVWRDGGVPVLDVRRFPSRYGSVSGPPEYR